MQNCIVYLIGYAGTGKYTIAQELAKVERFIIVDNQLINHPVLTVLAADGKSPLPAGVWQEVQKVRDAVLHTVKELASGNANFIFTNELLDDAEDRQWFEDVVDIAVARNASFLPVRLTVAREENKRRVATLDRAARLKEIDPDALEAKIASRKLLRPDHTHLIELDVTHLTPAQAAHSIYDRLNALVLEKD